MFPLLPHNTNQHPLVQFSVESLLPSESWWPLTSFPPAFWSSKFPLEVKFFLQHPRAIPHRQLQTFLHSSHRGFRRPTNYIANKTCFSPFPFLVAVTKSLTKSILRQEGWIFHPSLGGMQSCWGAEVAGVAWSWPWTLSKAGRHPASSWPSPFLFSLAPQLIECSCLPFRVFCLSLLIKPLWKCPLRSVSPRLF